MGREITRILQLLYFMGWLAICFFEFAPASWFDPVLGKKIKDIFWPVLLAVQFVYLVMSWRYREVPADHQRPSEALIAAIVIVLTGLAGALSVAWFARTAAGYIVSGIAVTAILISTAILALLSYRHADRNTDRIGQARLTPTDTQTP